MMGPGLPHQVKNQRLARAWMVPILSYDPPVPICTPSGMSWVTLDSLPESEGLADWTQGLTKPCVWAMAHLAMPMGWGVDGGHGLPSAPCPPDDLAWASCMPSAAARVLLMAPMRAPPG